MQKMLARWFPHARVTIVRAGMGASTPVFRVRVDDEIYWARLGEEPGEHRDGEVAAHRLVSSQELPVPNVLRYETAPPELDRSVTLTTHVPGVPISTLQPAPWLGDVAVEVGRILARINAIEVSGFGWAFASESHGAPKGERDSRNAWVAEYREALHRIETSGAMPVDVMRVTAGAVHAWTSEPDRSTAWLAHGDFDSTHVYVDPERRVVTGIIDFGELRGADRLYDLGHLLLHDGESGRPELFANVFRGYGEVCPLPDDVITRIQTEALVIGTRALAIQLGRAPSPYRDWLAMRLVTLARWFKERHSA